MKILRFADGNPNIWKLSGECKIFIVLVRSLWLHASFFRRTKDSNPFAISSAVPHNPGCPGPSELSRLISWQSPGQGDPHRSNRNLRLVHSRYSNVRTGAVLSVFHWAYRHSMPLPHSSSGSPHRYRYRQDVRIVRMCSLSICVPLIFYTP